MIIGYSGYIEQWLNRVINTMANNNWMQSKLKSCLTSFSFLLMFFYNSLLKKLLFIDFS